MCIGGCLWNQKVMYDLKISLLGKLSISLNEKSIEGVSNYGRALLIYLAIEKHRPYHREVLAELLWPDRPGGVARNNLKQALSTLRKALGDQDHASPYLLVLHNEIQFNQSSPYWIDGLAFIEGIEACGDHAHTELVTCETCKNRLLRAVELYRGDFLAEFCLPENRDFNDWIWLKQEVFRRHLSDALCKLALIYEARGDYTGASDFCRQLAELEPWNEENHRNLMRLLALDGKRSIALRQFQICCEHLENELGVAPSNVTVALYEEIKAWEPETFPVDDSPQISIGNGGQIDHPAEKRPRKPVATRKLSMQNAVGLVLAGIALGIGSIYWRGARNPATSPLPIETKTPKPSLMPASSLSEPLIFEDESQALIALYENAAGPKWAHSDGWLSDRPPCDWYGITCQEEKITGLNLANNQLKGNVPPELGNLSHLKQLNLTGNRELGGSIPPELGNLSNLVELKLASWDSGGSLIRGKIPPELGHLAKLQILSIGTSLLEGSLPLELFELTELTVLDLASNRLSGPIPPEFGKLIHLEFLDLGGNDFGGPLPPELGNLTMLRYFSVGDSLVSGEIPAELGNLVRLRYLVLDTTGLFGPLPLTLMNLNLRELKFFGTDLCEPIGDDFRTWLDSIDSMEGTQVMCGSEDL